MESFLGWIGHIVDWFGLFIPRRVIVRKTDRLIKFKWDGNVVEKDPGLRWYLPFTTEIIELTVVRQPLDIRTTRFTTKDNIPCIVDCSVTYYITDAITFLTENFDGNLALSELINAALCKKLRAMTFREIQDSESLNSELTELVATDAEFLGVEIEYVRTQDLTWVLPVSLVGNEGMKNG